MEARRDKVKQGTVEETASTASPQPARQFTPAEQEALALRQLLIPSCLAAIVHETEVSRRGAMVYMRAFIGEAGDPSDPVERLLLEQLLMAHHRLAKLHVQADDAKSPESQKVLNTAAARLLGEIRRMALAIRQYRQPVSPRQFNVVHQQNIATGVKQDVTYVDRSTPAGADVSFSSRTELGDNPPRVQRQEDDHSGSNIKPSRKIPGPRHRRKNQRLQAAAVDD